jgi:hypothetical protein
MIPVPLFDLKFLAELAAAAVGTSNRRHCDRWSTGEGAGVGPALPRPDDAGLIPGEELRGRLVAVPQMKNMAVVVPVAVVHAAMATAMPTAAMPTAAMPAAGGRVAHGRERSGGERNRSDGDGQECAWGGHGLSFDSDRAERKNPPGRIRPGGRFIAICLVRVRDVADVDVTGQVRAPHPARRVATRVEAEMAVMTVVVVAVVVVVMMAVVVMAVMAVTTAVSATMSTTVAGRRIARGGEGRNGQHNGSSSGSEDGTLHWNFSWVDPERLSPWRMSG